MKPAIAKSPRSSEALSSAVQKKTFRQISGYNETPTLDVFAAMLLGEAESEDLATMRALARTVMTRYYDKPDRYGTDPRVVLLKPGQYYGLSRSTARKRIQNAFSEGSEKLFAARRAAYEALSGRLRVPDFVQRATHFDTRPYSHPRLKRLGRVGKFYFFRED